MKKQQGKRILSLLMVLIMCLGMLPTSVFAADTDYEVGAVATVKGSTAEPTGTIPYFLC